MSASRKRTSKRRKTYAMKGCNRKGCNMKNCSKHATNKQRATNKKRRNKTYKMRGGSGSCSSCGGMKGGCCGACVMGGMKGGNALESTELYPNGLTPGSPMPYNSYSTGDISRNMIGTRENLIGGYTYDKKKDNRRSSAVRQKGGWRIIPQDVTNFGRGATSMAVGAYNALQGYPQPVSYLPYEDQFLKKY